MNTTDKDTQNEPTPIKGLIDIISDELDKIEHNRLTLSKLYLTPNALSDIESSQNFNTIDKTVYGVTYEIMEDLTELDTPWFRNDFFAIS